MVLNPRISIAVQNNITLTQPGGPGVIAIIGTAQWGSLSEMQSFDSFAQLLDYYKEDKSSLSQGIVRQADLAFANGAQVVKVIRIGDGSQAKSTKALNGNSGGEVGVLTFSGFYHGTYGDNILVTVTTQGVGRAVQITDGVSTEVYDNSGATDGYTTNAAIASAINAGSALVSVAVKVGSETANLVDAASNQALVSGSDGLTSIDAVEYTTAFDGFLSNESWDILLCSGTDALNATDAFHSTMVGKVTTRATSDKKYGIFIGGVTLNESIATMGARTTANERFVLCTPGIAYTPRYQTATTNLNGTFLACAIAGKIASADVEVSPTRKALTVSPIVSTTSGKQYYNNSEIEQILQKRIIPVSLIEGAVKVARGVTRIADTTSVYFEINIVRIVDYVKAQVQVALDPFLGQANLPRIRKTMATEVDGILNQDRLDEVITDYQSTEVTQAVSPDTVNVSMTIQPTFAVNFINVNLAVSRLS